MKDDILIGDTPKAVRRRGRLKVLNAKGRLWKHSKLADIEGVVSEGEMRDFFVFTLVRNPWDRMVSYYHWLKAQTFDHPAVTLSKAHEFSAFLNHPATRESLKRDGAEAYLTSPSGQVCGDCYIRLEHMAEDLAPLEAHLGFGLSPLPHANASDRPEGYRAAYSEADAALIGSLFADDIARFGYIF
jgi:hypothetical protein